MSRTTSHHHRSLWPSYVALLLFISILTLSTTLQRVGASPLPDLTQEYVNLMSEISETSTANSMDNSTEIAPNTDVYVIKAIVYEIGILTDTDNTTSSESTERHETVDISLYDTPQQDEFS